MILYLAEGSELRITAAVGMRGAAVLARLGYMSENALEHEAKKAARRERLDALRDRKTAEYEAREAEINALL